jgi:NADH-quinone oxidoreductase subunit C
MTEHTPGSLAQRLTAHFGDRIAGVQVARNEVTVDVPAAQWHAVASDLRDHADFRFEQLVDICGVDYLGYGTDEWDTEDVTREGFSRGVEGNGPGRFDWSGRPRVGRSERRYAVVAHLLSITHNRRVRLKTFCPDDGLPTVATLTSIWPVANWFEREAFDLFGIVFEGHPDLRRILTDYGFVGHPFRKDFPLIGNVEVRYDPQQQRVIYEPVSIEPRVLVPRVIRDDSRYEQARAETAAATPATGK